MKEQELLFSNAAASVPESGLKQLVKTAGMEGGMRQLGGEFAKNLMTPQTAIRGTNFRCSFRFNTYT